MNLINIGSLLKSTAAECSNKNSSIFHLDLEILLATVLDVERVYLHTWPEKEITPIQEQQFRGLLKRRLTGEPLAYIVGYKEFWSLCLKITPAVLVPRPETEMLVELILKFYPTSDVATIPSFTPIRVLELGTGSGAIALAIASERPSWEIIAIEHSTEALSVAKENADHLKILNVNFLQSHWFSRVSQTFDIIVSNPPYLAPDDPHLSNSDIAFEPKSALVSPPDGLGDLKQIITETPHFLNPKGRLFLEHGYDQETAVMQSMQAAGFQAIQNFKDLAGHSRVTVGQFFDQ